MATSAKSKKTTKKIISKKAVKKTASATSASAIKKVASASKNVPKKSEPIKPIKSSQNSAMWGLIALLVVSAAATVYVLNKGTQDNTNIVSSSVVSAKKKDITDTISANGSLSTTKKLLDASGVAASWKQAGPYTVFVGTDTVWTQLLKAQNMTLEDILKPENKATLVSMFNTMTVNGRVASKDLQDGQKVTFVDGSTETLSIKNGKVSLIDDQDGSTATVTKADLEATNGVIHIIGELVEANQ